MNDLPQTWKLFADGRTMITGCSTDFSTTDSTEKNRPPMQKNYMYNFARRTQNWSHDNWRTSSIRRLFKLNNRPPAQKKYILAWQTQNWSTDKNKGRHRPRQRLVHIDYRQTNSIFAGQTVMKDLIVSIFIIDMKGYI